MTSERNEQLDEVQASIAEHVMREASKPVWFGVQKPVTPFIGRVSELSELRWGRFDGGVVIVAGPRGVGKTELARKYAQEARLDNHTDVIWVDSTTHEAMVGGFKELALNLGYNLADKSVTTVLREVFSHFSHRRAVYVLDHAAFDNVIVRNLATLMGRSHKSLVIITSRHRDWEDSRPTIQLGPFTPAESLEYLKTVLSRDTDITVPDADGAKLAALLKHLPLALANAAAYIAHKNTQLATEYTVADYTRDLLRNELPAETTPSPSPPPPSDDQIDESILDKIKQEGDRVGDQIADGAKEAWEKLSDESTRVGNAIAGEAERTGKRISDEAARVEKQVRDFFSFG